MSTRVALYSAGSFTSDAKPTVLSLPLMLKLSLSDMGRPWSGPTTWPVLLRCSSRALAVSIASSKKASLRQFVWKDVSYNVRVTGHICTNCCAAAARLQNALVTFSELHDLDAICRSICVAVLSVISSSSGVNHPDSLGHPVTSSCESGGNCCCGTRYSGGIEDARASRFAPAIFSQFFSDVIAQIHNFEQQQLQGRIRYTKQPKFKHAKLYVPVRSPDSFLSSAQFRRHIPTFGILPRFTTIALPYSTICLSKPRILCNYATPL